VPDRAFLKHYTRRGIIGDREAPEPRPASGVTRATTSIFSDEMSVPTNAAHAAIYAVCGGSA
jgi:hypothetical protein